MIEYQDCRSIGGLWRNGEEDPMIVWKKAVGWMLLTIWICLVQEVEEKMYLGCSSVVLHHGYIKWIGVIDIHIQEHMVALFDLEVSSGCTLPAQKSS